MCDHEDREAAMVVIQEGISEAPGDGAIWCDPCLVLLVTALNDGGLPTVASCCGHGHRPGSVILADGSTLLVLDKAWGDLLSSFIHSQVGCQEGRECSACVAPQREWPACSTYPALGCVCRGGLAPSKSTCTRRRTGDLQPVARMSQPRAKGGNHLDTRDARQWPWPMFVTGETVLHAARGTLHEWVIDCDTSGVCVPIIMRDVERPRLADPRVDPDWIRAQREAGWPDMHPEDYCHRCGARNPTWSTDSETWNIATAAWPDEPRHGGICCPGCLAEMYEAATGQTLVWAFSPASPPGEGR